MGKKLSVYFVLFSFILALLTFGGGRYFYYFWFISVSLSIIYILSIISRGKIMRYYAQLFLLLSVWMIYELLVTPWVTNSPEHLKILLLSFLYTIFSIICAIIINHDFERFIKFIEISIIVWVLFNLLSFVLYFHIGKDFSGVYFNRNILATTGLIFFGFMIFLKSELILLRGKTRFIIIFITLLFLILSTQSSKGLIGLLFIAIAYLLSLKSLKRFISIFFISILGYF